MSHPTYRFVGAPVLGGTMVVCDHAANQVPEDIRLGLPEGALEKHIAYDIGAAGVVDRLARRHNIPAMMAQFSRLVVDLHREEGAAGVIPTSSDGILVPGNIGADLERRLDQYYRPYHEAMAAWFDQFQPGLILSVHSFTPQLESAQDKRPWDVGLLYNDDDRAAQHAIFRFKELGYEVGENEPYSGRELNATMNRHAEAFGRPYCAIEIRNDLISDEAGQARWAANIATVAQHVLGGLERTS